ncbi:MAG TPA: FAD-dependent oxidoreductase [Caulobacteraceae bacterium]|jgi:glycine/D-amino acid oxidase-like deaminating enzyme|nr:FAD-dependent oxidoreductase [Caulobacteraceae bacterium]
MDGAVGRRRLIGAAASAGLLGLGGCATAPAQAPRTAMRSGRDRRRIELAPIRASADRLFDLTVCIRPFRAAGPRLDTETVDDTLVVHNYGHGGSGWSLSWGSGTIAVEKAMASSPSEIAVLGCGALGLTSAILAQRAGAHVTIYARDLMAQTRSARATGSWTPDSRIALTSAAGPAFGPLWERMARISWKTYRQYLGLPGTPVEFMDEYRIPGEPGVPRPGAAAPPRLDFAELGDRIADLTPRSERLEAGDTPFNRPVGRNTTLVFNIADYGHTLMTDFLLAGGRIVRREFHEPSELAALPQKVVINCPGYAARALWKDESITPVRGQIGWLIPQPEAQYGVTWGWAHMLSRRDGIVVQAYPGEMFGYGDDQEVVDRAESERTTAALAELYAGFGGRDA